MATDPICGMQVDESTALSVEQDGQTHYFCSADCRATCFGQGGRFSCVAGQA